MVSLTPISIQPHSHPGMGMSNMNEKDERIEQLEHALKLLQATYKEMLKEIDMLRELVKSADPERVLPNKEITNNTSE